MTNPKQSKDWRIRNEMDTYKRKTTFRSRSAMRKAVVKENKKWPRKLREIPPADWPDDVKRCDSKPYRIWRSRDYLVQLYFEHSGARISVNRTVITRSGNWSDQLSWDELQDIKSQIGFAEIWAFECYPPDGGVVNVSNMRHLWVPFEPINIGWR